MKKFFIVLGSIFLALIVLVAIGIAFIAIKGTALDKESKAYADSAIPPLSQHGAKKNYWIAPVPNLRKLSP